MYFYPKLTLQIFLGLILPAAVLVIVERTAGLDDLTGRIVLVIAVLWFAYWAVRAYFIWYRYHNDLWVVTDQRVVDSIKRHWFHHRMASADLVDVEDMSVFREGLLPTIFNFGDVRCQTAGQVANFVLAGIPKPAEVLGLVDAARDTARRDLRRTTGD